MAKSLEHNIFPELSPRAELFEKAGLIEKAWLDRASLGFPQQLPEMLRGFSFFRLKGSAATFDEQQSRLLPHGLPPHFVTAAYSQGIPLVWALHGYNGRLHVYLGSTNQAASAVLALLGADLDPALFEPDYTLKSLGVENYRSCAALTGLPHYADAPAPGSPSERPPAAERLALGLMGTEWLYVVQAFPIPREQTSLWLEQCTREIKDVKEAFLLRDIQKANRTALYYTEILEKSVRRLRLGKQHGQWQVGVYLLSPCKETACRGAALLSAIFSGDKSSPEPVRTHLCTPEGGTLPFINCYHSKELEALLGLPGRELPGYCLRELGLFDVDFNENEQRSLGVGRIDAYGHVLDLQCSVPVDDLSKHVLVAGVTGSGKTNTVLNLLKELYAKYQIPFLVIEPAKSEYRRLLLEFDNLLVFTLGEERPGVSAPFRLNPFAFPPGISLQTHLDFLKAVFNAAFVMYAPMPYVLDECLVKVYEDKGWNLVTSTNHRGMSEAAFPTLSDLYGKIDEVVERLGYQDRTARDIRAALQTRIRNLCLGGKGMMLNCSASIPWLEIMSRPTVLELKYLGNDEEKAFLMGLILMSLWEHYESHEIQRPGSGQGLGHITVIEEAHRLLKNVPTEKASEETSNIRGQGIETFCHLLAEIRAYGEGILVSEQIPAKLAPDVLKNSNVKIMHRLVSREDRDLMGDTMNLDLHQKRQVASLDVGEAIFYGEGLDRPLKIRVPCSSEKMSETMVTPLMARQEMDKRFYQHHPAILEKFPACRDCRHRSTDRCEQIKREVENRGHSLDYKVHLLKFFFPYLLDPNRGDVWHHLNETFGLSQEDAKSLTYCFAAHLINDYLRFKGDEENWPLTYRQEVQEAAQQALTPGTFAAVLGTYCRRAASRVRVTSKLCEAHCSHRCLLKYEGSFLSQDPVIHNRLVQLLRSDETGPGFYLELLRLVLDFLGEYIPSDFENALPGLAVCFMVQKLKGLKFSISEQRRVLDNFVGALSSLEKSQTA